MAVRIESDKDARYNCVGWALGRSDEVWWPDRWGMYRWPEGAPREESLSAFVEAFRILGYGPLVPSEKRPKSAWVIALYVDKEKMVTHVARLRRSGDWTSKIGARGNDVAHDRPGDCSRKYGYGRVACLLVRRSGRPIRKEGRPKGRAPKRGSDVG